MSEPLPVIYLARHGETAWSISGQHTGLTDLPLTDRGERNARCLGERFKGLSFTKVFTSPLQRARRTSELAGFGDRAEVDRDLLEWNYGDYEGRRTEEIHAERPEWQLFRDLLSTASLSALGYEHNLSQPAIQLWNDTNHVARDR
ncbi:histidine phosphatase family protein [Candidatus Binatus sp.]|uniref:histidine phosphatase family protein n=1 Tax=Candidatus Binatus sp. TaxID=2811406 RepID=UPI003CAEA702